MYYANQQQQQQQHPFAPSGGAPHGMDNQFKFANVSPEVLNYGLSAGQDMLKQQRDRLMPGVSGLWNSLKYYFSVDNSYVVKKLLCILYPFRTTTWGRIPADETDRENENFSSKWALPKNDINSPDLYIPLMAFVTYVLLWGLSKGVSSGSVAFSPDMLIQAIWRCLFLQAIESFALKFALSTLSPSLPYWDMFAYSGYKYVGLCLNTIFRVLGGPLHILVSLYFAGTLGFFILKTLSAATAPQGGGGASYRHIVLLASAASQVLLVLILSWF